MSVSTGVFEYIEGVPFELEADELIRRAQRVAEASMPYEVLTSPSLVSNYLWGKLTGREREVFSVLYLNNQNCLIEYVEEFEGTYDAAAVYPREIVKKALSLNAAAIIIAHNHPSGDPTPSESDKRLTKAIKEACGILDIRLLDHIVVGAGRTLSFAEHGLI